MMILYKDNFKILKIYADGTYPFNSYKNRPLLISFSNIQFDTSQKIIW